MPGTYIGNAFRLVRPLGEGGMSEVWLAEETSLGRKVALKVVKADDADNGRRFQRFKREAYVLALLDHPSILPAYDAGVDSATGFNYLSMKPVLLTRDEISHLCDALFDCPEPRFLHDPSQAREFPSPLSLRDLIEGGKSLPEATVARIGLDIVDALSFAHGHAPPIVHRDVKPSNILFDAGGHALLSDFGLAKMLGDSIFDDITSDDGEGRHFLGTPFYASPEQSGQAFPLSPAMDYHSLGTVFYRALTGVLPRSLKHPSRFDPAHISRRWDSLLSRMLETDPSRRLFDPAVITAELNRILIASGRHRTCAACLAAVAIVSSVSLALARSISAAGRWCAALFDD